MKKIQENGEKRGIGERKERNRENKLYREK